VKCTGASLLALLEYRELYIAGEAFETFPELEERIAQAVAWLSEAATDSSDIIPVVAQARATYHIRRRIGWPTVPTWVAERIIEGSGGMREAVVKNMGSDSLSHLLRHGFGRLLSFDWAATKEALLALSRYHSQIKSAPIPKRYLPGKAFLGRAKAGEGQVRAMLRLGVEGLESTFSVVDGWGEFCCDDPFVSDALAVAAEQLVRPEDRRRALDLLARSVQRIDPAEPLAREPKIQDICSVNSTFWLCGLVRPDLITQYVKALSEWITDYADGIDPKRLEPGEYRPDYVAWFAVVHVAVAKPVFSDQLKAELEAAIARIEAADAAVGDDGQRSTVAKKQLARVRKAIEAQASRRASLQVAFVSLLGLAVCGVAAFLANQRLGPSSDHWTPAFFWATVLGPVVTLLVTAMEFAGRLRTRLKRRSLRLLEARLGLGKD